MNIKFLNIIKDILVFKKNGVYIDCTFGKGYHSLFILSMLGEKGRLLSFDCDYDAISLASNIKDKRFQIIHSNFSLIKNYTDAFSITGKVDGIFFDLGLSDNQLNNPLRGFSFLKKGPLDMRMDRSKSFTAKKWLYQASEKEICHVIRNFGEEFYAKKIAKQIVFDRKRNLLNDTLCLSNLVKSIIGYKKFKHQATRTFQAIRIYINNELYHLQKVLNVIYDILAPQGKLFIISFHSLEDRIVKRFIKSQSSVDNFLSNIPLTMNEITKLYPIKMYNLGKFKPSKQEIRNNPRIRSAILRVAEKI